MKKTQRMAYIDWLKASGICFIVAGHFLPSACWLKTLLYSFHVPLFAMVSGLLACAPQTYRECLRRMQATIMRLFVPYLFWFVVFAWPHLLPADQVSPVVKFTCSIEDMWKLFLCWEGKTIWNSTFWFIPAYLIISLFFPIYLKFTHGSHKVSFLFSLLSFATVIIMEQCGVSITLFGVQNIMGARNMILLTGFYALGYSIKDVVNAFVYWERKTCRNLVCFAAIIGFMATSYFTIKANYVGSSPYPAGYYVLSLYSGQYNGMFQFIGFAVLLCICLIFACGFLPQFKIAELLSNSTLFITSTHYVFYLDESFRALSRKKWRLDLAYSIRDIVFIITVYLVILYLLDCLSHKYPKLKSIFRLFGI